MSGHALEGRSQSQGSPPGRIDYLRVFEVRRTQCPLPIPHSRPYAPSHVAVLKYLSPPSAKIKTTTPSRIVGRNFMRAAMTAPED